MNNIDINEKESKLVIDRFNELKTERSKYITRWKDIENYVAITNEVNVEFDDHKQPTQQKDVYINSPTAFTSVWQAGDYLAGILWSDNATTLEPSDYIKKVGKGEDFSEFYKNASIKFLEQMNATDAGFSAILKSYAYDQFSYGTSGIGTFKSKEYEKEQYYSSLSPEDLKKAKEEEKKENRKDFLKKILLIKPGEKIDSYKIVRMFTVLTILIGLKRILL